MKKFLLVVLIFSSIVVFGQQVPDSPATEADVMQFFEASNSRKTMDTTMQVMAKQMPAMLEPMMQKELPDATPEQRQIMQDFMNKTIKESVATMPLDEMLKSMIPVYQKHFSHADIQQIVAFYASPVGEKLLQELPAIQSEGMQNMMPIIQKWSEQQNVRNRKRIEEFVDRMKASAAAPTKHHE